MAVIVGVFDELEVWRLGAINLMEGSVNSEAFRRVVSVLKLYRIIPALWKHQKRP